MSADKWREKLATAISLYQGDSIDPDAVKLVTADAHKILLEAVAETVATFGSGDDRDDYLTKSIDAMHPLRTGDHTTYAKAVELVGNRHDKYSLVDLVNYLLRKGGA